MAALLLTDWIKNQKLKGPAMTDAPVFYRNLEEAIDKRRREHAHFTLRTNLCREGGGGIDFISNDMLSLGASGLLRAETLRELERHPELSPGAGSTRLVDGNYRYIERAEAEIAQFHGAESGLLVGSGFNGNVAIFTAIPRAGDAIVFDELVHASAHEGIARSKATQRAAFRHNDPDSLREVLTTMRDAQPLIQQGKQCVLVAVETTYSFDGDICPLQELVAVAKEVCPLGNVQFVVDEAHSTGVIGPKGAGLVCELGLEKEIAVRLHTYGKALASSGAIILGTETVKNALLNFGRCITFSTAPGPFQVAAIRSAYSLMKEGRTETAQTNVQHLVRHFFKTAAANPTWVQATARGLLDLPLAHGCQERSFLAPIVALRTRPRHAYWLAFHLMLSNFSIMPLEYPAVPKGKSQLRLTFHANNTQSEVDGLVSAVAEWAKEMIDLEDGEAGETGMPKAARQVYAWMESTVIQTPNPLSCESHAANEPSYGVEKALEDHIDTGIRDKGPDSEQTPSMSAPEACDPKELSKPPNRGESPQGSQHPQILASSKSRDREKESFTHLALGKIVSRGSWLVGSRHWRIGSWRFADRNRG